MSHKKKRTCLGLNGLDRAFARALRVNVFKALVATQRDQVRTFQKLFPRAARKRRVRKKWIARFGRSFTDLFEAALQVPRADWWQTKGGLYDKPLWKEIEVKIPFLSSAILTKPCDPNFSVMKDSGFF